MGILSFHSGGKLSSPALENPLPSLTFPTLMAWGPERFPLQGIGKVLLGDPMLPEGMRIAVALTIAEGVPITIGIPEMGGDVLALGASNLSKSLEEATGAVALVGGGQIERCLGQGPGPRGPESPKAAQRSARRASS